MLCTGAPTPMQLPTPQDHYGVRGDLLRWIAEFLQNRTFTVKILTEHSQATPVLSGVPQGSVLGPILFNIYVSDLASLFNCPSALFADDTKIFSNPLENPDALSNDLKLVEDWCDKWLLSTNEAKCTVLHIGSNNPHKSYYLNGIELQSVKQRDLGVIISSDLKWASHIGAVVKKVNSLRYLVAISFKNIYPALLERIYKSYVRPIFDYAAPVWNPYFAGDIHILEQAQRRFTKLSPALKHLPYEQRLTALHLSSLTARRIRGDLIETYKILHGHYTCHLSLFVLSTNLHLRGHNLKLVRERFYKLCRQHFLTNRIPNLWNTLPDDVIAASSLNAFKNRLDAHFSNSF
ncbi:hypothetical protein Zmor_001973 [Zophobas morio]|uniref:Reverse transcriptase domain-containing protein n=1 Tax=Zophobas morio TaxID=2755281 RepID=A0AA38MT13_9CUCU|nr:hypothetical protein Zmor_001973 [Zophobas morio]